MEISQERKKSLSNLPVLNSRGIEISFKRLILKKNQHQEGLF